MSAIGTSRGLPSTGCNHCRTRKVKCDEARPACNRCARAGATDCEYRDPFALAWRDQTDFASERANKGWRKRAKGKAAAEAAAAAAALVAAAPVAAAPAGEEAKREGSGLGGFTSINSVQGFMGFTAGSGAGRINSEGGASNDAGVSAGEIKSAAWSKSPETSTATPIPSNDSSVASSMSPSSTVSSLSPLSMATPPAPHLEPTDSFKEQVLQRFWFDWTISEIPPTQSRDSFFPFLRMMFQSVPAGSVLKEAVLALAYANYGARLDSPVAKESAMLHYGKVIPLLRRKVGESNHGPLTNDVMLSVILLGMYETMVAPTLEVNGHWSLHAVGVFKMLNERVMDSPAVNKLPAPLFSLIITQMLTNSVLRGKKPTMPIEVRQKLAGTIQDPKVNEQYLLVYDVAELCGEWRPALEAHVDGTPGSIDKLKELAFRAVVVDKNLQGWTEKLPLDWNYHIVGVEKELHPEFMWPLLEGDWFPSQGQCYDSLMVEIKWRLHFAMKLILNHALLFTIDALEKAGEAMDLPVGRHAVEGELLSLIDRISESCLASFLTPLLNKPKPTRTDEICSARGFMLMQTLPAAWMCLVQAPVTTFDVSPRLQWLTKMLEFVGRKIGFAKGTSLALINNGAKEGKFSSRNFSLQLWGAPE